MASDPVRRWLPIDVAARVGVKHMDDILVVNDFVKKAICPPDASDSCSAILLSVSNPSVPPRRC